MNRRPGSLHRSIGLACLSILPAMSMFQGLISLAGGHDSKPDTFYQAGMDYASSECSFQSDPLAFDRCWRATLADFYRLDGKV